MTVSLMKYGRVFLFDPEGNSVAAYRSDNVDRKLIDYLKEQPIKRPNSRHSYQSVTVPMQDLAISENYLHYLWPN